MSLPFPTSAVAALFAVFVALWPLACLAAVIHASFTRRWARVVRAAMLLPLWTIAASVGMVSLSAFGSAAKAAQPLPAQVKAAVGVGFALCCAAAAWWLLIRSLREPLPRAEQV
jgi:hypothetical protein